MASTKSGKKIKVDKVDKADKTDKTGKADIKDQKTNSNIRVTTNDMLDYLTDIPYSLTREIRQEILDWIAKIGGFETHDSADGCRIMLDNLPPDKITEFYNFVKARAES